MVASSSLGDSVAELELGSGPRAAILAVSTAAAVAAVTHRREMEVLGRGRWALHLNGRGRMERSESTKIRD